MRPIIERGLYSKTISDSSDKNVLLCSMEYFLKDFKNPIPSHLVPQDDYIMKLKGLGSLASLFFISIALDTVNPEMRLTGHIFFFKLKMQVL